MQALLVQNNPLLTRALRHVLQEEGYRVEIALDHDDADRMVRLGGHDLIILDLLRFREKGVSLLQSWRKAGLATWVLALTAPGSGSNGADMVASGASTCLTVPFRLDDLLTCLRENVPVLADQVGT